MFIKRASPENGDVTPIIFFLYKKQQHIFTLLSNDVIHFTLKSATPHTHKHYSITVKRVNVFRYFQSLCDRYQASPEMITLE